MKWLLTWAAGMVLSASAQPQEPASPGAGPGMASDPRAGWHFHLDPDPAPPPQAVPPTAPVEVDKHDALERFRRLQQELEERRALAVIMPSPATVRRYMELEAQVVGKASLFADIAQRIAWSSPELDPSTQGRPVNAVALEVFERERAREREVALARVAREHALLFFFRGDCGYCHAMAPALDAFRRRYGIRVIPVSADGGTLPGFADARADNGVVQALKVGQFPAVFLAHPFSGRIEPVGFGVLSEAQLAERIVALAGLRNETRSDTSAMWLQQR